MMWNLLVLVLALAVPCAALAQEAKVIRIVKQPGLGYLELIVMREQKLIEKRLPGVAAEWKELTSGPVIRDAMLAGQMDIGSGGLAPFILAVDKGLGWKIIGALNEMPLFLNCDRPEIRSVRDLKPGDKIAMPAVGSIQHIILQMEAQKELGSPKALDALVVAMSHPDGTAALLSKREITCHLSAPPFQYEQLRTPGIHKVFDSYQAVGGPHTFNLVWTSQKWAVANPTLFKAFGAALEEAVSFINTKPQEAARLYAATERTRLTPEQVLEIIRAEGIKYTTTPTGLMTFAAFMQKEGLIKKLPSSWKDYAFEHLQGAAGN